MTTSDPGSIGEVQLENEFFHVTKWTIQPGGHIPQHVHEHEYVCVPLRTSTMHVFNTDGTEIEANLVEGQSYTRGRSEHTCFNRSEADTVEFVEIERLA